MHFPVYIVLVLLVGPLCGADHDAVDDEKGEREKRIEEKIDNLIHSNEFIKSQLETIHPNVELQLEIIQKLERDAKERYNKWENSLQQSQSEYQQSRDHIEELRNILVEIYSRINEIADGSQSSQPTYTSRDLHSFGYPNSCADHIPEYCNDDSCRIKVPRYSSEEFSVPCDNNKYGNGWTIIQKREDGSIEFQRNWVEYKSGFGNVLGEYWIGLDKLHALTTTQGRQELLVILEDYHGNTKYALYDAFEVGSEPERYKLKLGAYRGDAGDSLRYHENGQFHTKDNDRTRKCVRNHRGGWWYKNCLTSNPNGLYYRNENATLPARGTYWKSFVDANHSLKSIKMMIRPKYYTTSHLSLPTQQ
uniref:Fibrinogen C-terminal domain-containing protein n=1 Tax=Glossina brevipalpis TaxID=37001 RepID=A0A1A9WDG3_9MUSC